MDLTPEAWEDGLAALVVGAPLRFRCRTGSRGPGVDVLRRLVWNFRSGVLDRDPGAHCRLLLLHGGDPLTRDLFDGFFQSAPPQLFAAVEAEAFGAYLAKRGPTSPTSTRCWASTSRRSAPSRAAAAGAVPLRSRVAPEPLARGRLPVAPSPAGSKSRSPPRSAPAIPPSPGF